MGISYYTCDNPACGHNYPDCSDYCVWCDCNANFCSGECGDVIYHDNNEDNEIKSCIICRGEEMRDGELVSFLLKRCNLSREEAIDLAFKEKNNGR